MAGGPESKARSLLRPFFERGEVLTLSALTVNGAPAIMVRLAKLDPALKDRIRDALREVGCSVQFVGPLSPSDGA